MAPSKKRAVVVYILDASPSMKAPFAMKKASSAATATTTTTTTTLTTTTTTTTPMTTTTTTTRFESAKKALLCMVGNLKLQKTDNECCVILLKTRGTRHHLIADTQDVEEEEEMAAAEAAAAAADNNATATATAVVPFGHITELTPSIIKISCDMMQRIQQEMTIDYDTQDEADFLLPGGGGGDLCHGIILAMDALYKKTKRFSVGGAVQRSIVVITDGMHQGCVDFQQLLYAIDILRDLDCPIHVVGLDFPTTSSSSPTTTTSSTISTTTTTTTFAPPAPPPPVSYSNDKVHQCLYKGPQQWQPFLEALLDKTGGQLHIVHDDESLQYIAENNFAGFFKKKKEASGYACELLLAPNLTLTVKTFGLWARSGYTPSIKQNQAFQLEDRCNNNNNNSQSQSQQQTLYSQLSSQQQQPSFKINGLGERMLEEVKTQTMYVNLDKNPEHLFTQQDTAKAVNYADKWIAVDRLQLDALKYHDVHEKKTLQVLGYLPRCQVPMTLVMGPPVLVAGGVSQKSTVAIAALARALFHLDLVAITMYTKSPNGKASLGGLFPKQDQIQKYHKDKNGPLHLLFLELPFANDVKKGLPRSDWQDEAEDLMEAQQQQQQQQHANMAAVCDNLIDALTLSSDNDDDMLDIYNTPVSIPNPVAASWKQTIIQRVLDPNAPIVDARCGTTTTIRSSSTAAANDDDQNNVHAAVAMDIDDDGKNSNYNRNVIDPMGTPPYILKRAEASLSAFYQAFPAPKPDPKVADKKKKSS